VGVVGEFAELIVPAQYVGDPLAETSTYLNATFASLGMKPGTYNWSWGSGDHADTFTLQIGAAAPEASTWAMLLMGFAALGYAAVRRKAGAAVREV
jgi:PEP-CTERM motif